MSSLVRSQDKEFIAGAVIGFYGIHITGEINEMYSSTGGEVTGNGGLSFGVNVKHNITKAIYGALEMRYIHKGSIYGFTTNYGTQAFETIKLYYIELPVSVGLNIKLKKKHLLFETGFAYARLIKARMEVNDLSYWDPTYKTDHFRHNDFSWVANMKYPLIKSEKLLAGVRFSYSLFSVHTIYNLHNLDYGVEIYYLFN
jgi:hypothetical protein